MIQNDGSSQARPLVSVLMPAYNHERWISESIESVISQNYGPIELVIVNDGSRDRTGVIASDYQSKYPGIVRYQEQSNRGLCATLNRLVSLSRGEYVKVLASDDLLAAGVIAEHVRMMMNVSRKDVMACFGPRQCIDDAGGPLVGVRSKRQIKNLDYFSNLLLGRSPCMLQQMTIRKEAVSFLKFDERLASEDIDFLLRFFQNFSAIKCSQVSVLYRIHQHGLSKQSDANTANTEYVLRKVSEDPRFVSLGWKKIMATNSFHHAIYFSATGKKKQAFKRFYDGLRMSPLSIRYVPSSIPQLLLPFLVRNWIRRLRSKISSRKSSSSDSLEGARGR